VCVKSEKGTKTTYHAQVSLIIMSTWYTGKEARIVEYKLPFVDAQLSELETMVEEDVLFQDNLRTEQGLLEFFSKAVEAFEVYGNGISSNSSIGYIFPLLYKGIKNYCQFAMKQHERFKRNIRFISTRVERERVRTEINQCLTTARRFIGPFSRAGARCPVFMALHEQLTGALAEGIDLDVEDLASICDDE
jgi:hypothetical protein